MNFLKNLTIKAKIILLIAIAVAGFAVFGLFTYTTLNEVKIGSATYKEISDGQDLTSKLTNPSMALSTEVVTTYKMTSENDMVKLQQAIEFSKTERPAFEKAWEEQLKSMPDSPLKDMLKTKVYRPAIEWFDLRDRELIPLLLNKETEKAFTLATTTMKAKREEHEKATAEATKEIEAKNKKFEEDAAAMVASKTLMLMAFAVVAAALMCGLAFFIARSILGPLGEVVEKLKAISQGDTNQRYDYQAKDEIGTLADAFRNLNAYVKDMAAGVEALGRGDLSVDVQPRSGVDMLAKNLAQTVDTLNGIVAETDKLIAAARDGRLDARGDERRFSGAYAGLVGGVNRMLDAIVAPVNEASATLERIADGDLTARVDGDYRGDFEKIKNSLNLAAGSLDDGFQQVATSAEQVASAAGQISAGSQSLAQGASEQASTLEEVASSLQEISVMSRQNTSNSQEARSMSDSARACAERGMRNMNQLTQAIDKIKNSSDATARIVKTIEEIAFQTNLLALNAAVEAARAGDAGKGFAVVAEEVRNLAMRSAEAARSTGQLIDEAVANTNDGVALNTEVSQNLAEINGQIEKVSVVVSEIAAASEQQNQGVTQINAAIEQMNSVTQQAAANSEESASAAEELSGQSEEMLGLIATFRLSNAAQHARSKKAAVRETRKPAANHASVKTGNRPAAKKSNGQPAFAAAAPTGESLIPFDDFNDPILREF